MLEVKIEKILPVTEARDSFNKLVDEVEGTDELYVLTKNGKPAAVLVGVHHLEKLTGTSEEELMDQTNMASSDASTTGVPANDTTANPIVPDTTASEPAPLGVEDPAMSASIDAAAPATEPATSTPADPNQQSGATANPFENAGASSTPVPEAPPVTNTAPVAEDPLDFLNDSDADPTLATPTSAPTMPDNSAMNAPVSPGVTAPAEPTPAPTPMPTTDPTIPPAAQQ